MNTKLFFALFAILFTSCVPMVSPTPIDVTQKPSNTPNSTVTLTLTTIPYSTRTPRPITLTPQATIDFESYDLKWCVSDTEGDVSTPYIDVQRLYAISRGETFIAKLFIKSIPEFLTFNKNEVPINHLEYEWTVGIDVDGNKKTGFIEGGGTEYQLSITHFVAPNQVIKTTSILDGTQQDEWQHNQSNESYENIGNISVKINYQDGTLIMIGDVPGLSTKSRITFETYDYNPGSREQTDKPKLITTPPSIDCN